MIRVWRRILVVLLIASQTLYAMAPSASMVVVSRALMGVASTTSTVCRSVVAQGASREERTRQTAAINAASTLGFVLGPAIGSHTYERPKFGNQK